MKLKVAFLKNVYVTSFIALAVQGYHVKHNSGSSGGDGIVSKIQQCGNQLAVMEKNKVIYMPFDQYAD